MNRSMLAVLIGALMATGTVQAAAQDNTWYVGGKAGWSSFFTGWITTIRSRICSIPMIRTRITATWAWGSSPVIRSTGTWPIELGYDWLGKYQVDQRFRAAVSMRV